jgi:hypothetical protein
MTIARVHGRQSTDQESFNVPSFKPLAGFSFAYTTSVASAAVTDASILAGIDEVLVRLAATTDCWVAFGAAPTAVVGTGVFLPAGLVEVWRMNKGDKVAAVQDSEGGTLSVVLLE